MSPAKAGSRVAVYVPTIGMPRGYTGKPVSDRGTSEDLLQSWPSGSTCGR